MLLFLLLTLNFLLKNETSGVMFLKAAIIAYLGPYGEPGEEMLGKKRSKSDMQYRGYRIRPSVSVTLSFSPGVTR